MISLDTQHPYYLPPGLCHTLSLPHSNLSTIHSANTTYHQFGQIIQKIFRRLTSLQQLVSTNRVTQVTHPSYNGKARGLNRSILEILRRITTSLTEYAFHYYIFFPYLVKYACKLHNHTPRAKTNYNATPHQLFYSNKYVPIFYSFASDVAVDN